MSSNSETSENATADAKEATYPTLDSDKIYWDEDNELFFHVSGMHYDPDVKTFYTLIDQKGVTCDSKREVRSE